MARQVMARRLEDDLQRAVLAYIAAAIPYAIVFHVPNGGFRTKPEAARLKSLGVMPGVADLVLLAGRGRVFFLELKAPKGRTTEDQDQFGEAARALGCGWAVIRSIDDLILAFKAWGVSRTSGEGDGEL